MENVEFVLKLITSLLVSFVFFIGILLVLIKLFFKMEDSRAYEQRLKRFLDKTSEREQIKELTHQK